MIPNLSILRCLAVLVLFQGWTVAQTPKQLLAPTLDKGQETIGQLKVSLIYGTNSDLSNAGRKLEDLDEKQLQALKSLKTIKFNQYRLLGVDKQPILRSYENWSAPLRGTKEILLSFQPIGEAKDGALRLDLEFWQKKKKIMKGGILLKSKKPLYVQGPDWRGGKVIIVVELLSLEGFPELDK